MKIADFMKYFNQLTICRGLAKTWYEARYQESFKPSQGPMSTKTREWLDNNQYIFTFDNPEVKTARVNVKLEQADIRMLEPKKHQPPYTEKRMKIGFAILGMGKAQDKVVSFEPKRLLKIMKPQGTRIQTCSFAAETGKKYAIVPFTGQKGEEGSYTLTF